MTEGRREAAVTDTYYKWLNPDRTTTYQNVQWPKRVGVWTPNEIPALCSSGWHLATHAGIGEHARTGAVLWIAEGRGWQDAREDKVAFTSARLVSKVGTLTQVVAVQWAVDCARRVLRHYEAKYPDDKRPRQAINAAAKWAKDPSEKNRNGAANAAANAYAAAANAYAAAANAAAAAIAAANAAAYANAYAAADIADAAAYAANAAAAAAKARSSERQWQSDRLLSLLLATEQEGPTVTEDAQI